LARYARRNSQNVLYGSKSIPFTLKNSRVWLDNDLVVNLTKFFTAQKHLTHLELYFNYTTIYDLWIQEIFESMNFVNMKSLTLGLRSCGLDNPCVMRLAAMIGTIEVKESLSMDLGG
jgi:hypothetical protein